MIKPRWAAYLAIAVLIAVAMACLAALSMEGVERVAARAAPHSPSRSASAPAPRHPRASLSGGGSSRS